MLTEIAPQAFVFKQSFKWDQGNFPQNKIPIYDVSLSIIKKIV